MDYPKTMYRGAFSSKAELEAAWNAQTGIEQRIVADESEQAAAAKLGFVERPIEMILIGTAAPAQSTTLTRKGAKDEPLNVNG